MLDRRLDEAVKLHPCQKSPESVGPDGGERSVVSAGRQSEAVTQDREPEFGQLSRRPYLAEAFPRMGDISDSVSLT
jgi:hypothetical protein